MFTGRDILLACYPILNQNGITPLVSDSGFLTAINNAINNTQYYKGYLWSWHQINFEITDPVIWEEGVYTSEYPITYINNIFVKDINGNITEYPLKRILGSYPLINDGYSYITGDKIIKYKLSDENIKSLIFSGFRGIPRINNLDEEIKTSESMKNAIVYFTLSEVIPVYHNYEQGRDINYYNKAIQYLEWLWKFDSQAVNEIRVNVL